MYSSISLIEKKLEVSEIVSKSRLGTIIGRRMCCFQNIIDNIFLLNAEPWKMNSRKEFANMLGSECCKVSVSSALVPWPPSSLDNYMQLIQTSLQFHLHMAFLSSCPEMQYRVAGSSFILEHFKGRQSSILSHCLQIFLEQCRCI